MGTTHADHHLPTDGVLTRAETRIASGYVCGLIGKEIATADFDNAFVRRVPSRRVEARKGGRRREDDGDGGTFHLT